MYVIYAYPGTPSELRVSAVLGWKRIIEAGWWLRSVFPAVPLEVRLTPER